MSGEMACHSCDLLVDVAGLQDGQSARCPRCGNFLTRLRSDAYDRVVAFASAALVLLVLACSYPFLTFSASGLESTITLLQTPGALWDYGMPGVALIVGAFIIAIPALVLVLLLVLGLLLSQRRYHPLMVSAGRVLYLAQNWSMVEVFIIGVIVALVKISSMATVVLDISFWAYSAFTVCFIAAVAALDRYQCWETIEALSRR